MSSPLTWLFGETTELPKLDEQFLASIHAEVQNTPDVAALEKKYRHFVFIPDSMMENRAHHDILGQDAYKVCTAFTQEKFTFWNYRGPGYSVAVPLELRGDAPWARIRGEVYLLSPDKIKELDKRFLNTVLYRREKRKFRIPFTPAKDVWVKEKALLERALQDLSFQETTLTAYMYVGEAEAWSFQLQHGIKVKHTDKMGHYTVSRISGGSVLTPIRVFKPHNPNLELYYFFTPHEYSNVNSS